MKVLVIALLALSLSAPAMARGGGGHGGGGHYSGGHSGTSHLSYTSGSGTGAKSQKEHVKGYTRKDGKQVKAHDRSTKDGTKNNNWSTKGNRNPETGKAGTKKGDGE